MRNNKSTGLSYNKYEMTCCVQLSSSSYDHKRINFVKAQSVEVSTPVLPVRIYGSGHKNELVDADLEMLTNNRSVSAPGSLGRVRVAVEQWQDKPKWWKHVSLTVKQEKKG